MLVFGAGTNYALLLISRYREELGRPRDEGAGDHRTALRTAVRHAGPAVLASNATVVLALLMLVFASSPSTRALGVQAAAGLVIAAVFVLLVLPPLLALFGTRLFWPFVPRPGAADLTTSGAWHRIADAVARRPGWVAAVAIAVLAALSTGVFTTPLGLSQTEQFRVQRRIGQRLRHPGRTLPQRADRSHPGDRPHRAGRRYPACDHHDLRHRVGHRDGPLGHRAHPVVGGARRPAGLRRGVRHDRRTARLGSPRGTVDGRGRLGCAGPRRRRGRPTDRTVIIPAILAVVLAVLYVLLRSALAPLLLVAVTVLSALAALGLGGWASVALFGFPALDNTTPLFAFLFLVALGVDYTIFLVTRAREETPEHGTRDGIVRAVSATGAVITSAGIVLAAVFCVLGVLPLIVLTQLGIIVGLGILLDTFVVRTVIIPALFTLIGWRIWWPALHAPGRSPGGAHRR